MLCRYSWTEEEKENIRFPLLNIIPYLEYVKKKIGIPFDIPGRKKKKALLNIIPII